MRLQINDIKVDLLNFQNIKHLVEKPIILDEIVLANSIDVGAMKISAIINRRTKKDFIDLSFLLEKFSLSRIIDAYKLKYELNSDCQALNYLTDFSEAELENNDNILMLNYKVEWSDIKKNIHQKLEEYLKT